MKRRKGPLQGTRRPKKAQPKPRTLHHAPLDFERLVYLTAEEAAEYLRFTRCDQPARAFRQWADRLAIPVKHRGLRQRLYKRIDLDAAVANPRCFTCPQ